ncbi:MAG: Stk1 family PASTA domain-containing Ser/Thr kinase [Clostridiales bacterium]|nr:Stk1 family PASTA domain-containing Ser/Thr kinase [Clostridiales bacterium]
MIGKMLDNRYELVEFIGKGGMALVYRAVDHRTGHHVAVKILRPEFNQDQEFLGRFDREATTASKMSHHNIVNLLDVGVDGDIHFLVMEYVKGRTLKEVIAQKGALPPAVAAQIGIRILSAMQHAHKNGIIHRDIKPQNILVHADGHIKVGDFGIARVAGSNTISSDDSVMGSVHYFSPEQAKGEAVTFSSDLYSVGVVLYEMLTAQPPFEGETPVAIALQHISGKPRAMSELNPAVPPAMERVVAKAMEKRPEKRYQSALEMAQDLQRALQEPDGTWLGRLPDRPQAVQDQQPVIHSTTRQMPVHSKNWLWTRISAIALAALVLFGLIFGTIKIYDQIVNITEAPYCLDEDEREALRMVARAGLKAEISRVSDSSKAAGTVVLQSPEYGSTMRKNETIFLTISTGPEEQPVPKITDMNVETARMELETVGFTLLALPERVLSNTPWDTVLSQSPAEGELLPSGGVVQVTLSGGSVILPDLTGKTRAEAMMLIQQYNLNLTEIKEIPVDDATQFERVAAQQYMDGNLNMYEPGQQAMQQTQVTLAIYVSSQPLPTEEAPAASEKADQEEEAT